MSPTISEVGAGPAVDVRQRSKTSGSPTGQEVTRPAPARFHPCHLRALGELPAVRPERLAQVPLLASLSPAELAVVALWISVECYPAGAMIVHQGEFADRLFVIASGRVQVLVDDARGEPQQVSALGAGSYFGEIALLDDHTARRTATVRSITPVELFSLERDDFRVLFRSQPRIAREVSWLVRVRLEQSRQAVGA